MDERETLFHEGAGMGISGTTGDQRLHWDLTVRW